MKKIGINELNFNVFDKIGKEWFLLTAGDKDRYNTMTASWGGMGILWNKPVCFTFVRPNRYTYEFMEDNSFFTLSFFREQHRSILTFCGSKSGRNVDKVKETGLVSEFTENGTPYFKQADMVIECKKLFIRDMKEDDFIDKDLLKHYDGTDYHRMYIGEICNVYAPE